jgi:hypothetical protein
VPAFMGHARALLKPDATVGAWICLPHRDKLRRCVEQAAQQDMVCCRDVHTHSSTTHLLRVFACRVRSFSTCQIDDRAALVGMLPPQPQQL